VQLLPAGIGKLDQFVQGALGYTDGDGAEHQRKEWQHGLIERSREARYAVREIEEIRRRDNLVPECDVMAPSTLEPYDVPSILDLPVARRQEEAPDQRRPSLAGWSGEWLSALGHDT
jgi:hypothetical protein